MADASVRRYGKSGVVQHYLRMVSNQVLKFGELSLRALEGAFQRKRGSLVPAPTLAAAAPRGGAKSGGSGPAAGWEESQAKPKRIRPSRAKYASAAAAAKVSKEKGQPKRKSMKAVAKKVAKAKVRSGRYRNQG